MSIVIAEKRSYAGSMLYPVGSKIDLRELNESFDPAAIEPPENDYDTYIPGTKISFMTMARGMIVTNVNEPPLRLSVAVV